MRVLQNAKQKINQWPKSTFIYEPNANVEDLE